MNAMKFGNVVLLSSPRANPWVELIENKLNFRYVYDQTSHYSAFENHSARSGEPAISLLIQKKFEYRGYRDGGD
jgi:hypothetical protein